ncbi:hypothetical protein B0J11DRAFT_560337 [Dendryphion nanum]|uniref:Riboflavin kinase n=1 Tax=Dendryphion nanum TaxID=256645 RepID=A0A9P9DIY5_9PLEO|nr:hypothetical protein B0J11DRAFT_560337 [Dendryphion nanum]
MPPPNGPRAPIAGPETPEPPYPLRIRGPVIKGFGRGSKELGIPTANIPLSGLSINGHSDLPSGIYFGYASLDHSTIPATSLPLTTSSNHAVSDLEAASVPPSRPLTPTSALAAKQHKVYPTVLSIGYNPYYKNTHRSIEIHILHTFATDFYGATLSLIILGYIRPEYDYVSREALVEDIREDIRVAERSLGREGYRSYEGDEWLRGGGVGQVEEGGEEKKEVKGRVGGNGQVGGTGVSMMEN